MTCRPAFSGFDSKSWAANFFFDGLGGFDLDRTDSLFLHSKLFRRGLREVDYAILRIGPSVVDLDFDLFLVFEIGHFHFGPQRQLRMGSRHFPLIENLAAGRLAAMKTGTVPRGFPYFFMSLPGRCILNFRLRFGGRFPFFFPGTPRQSRTRTQQRA